MAQQQHVAGIDRHAEMIDPAAGHLDRLRDHIAPVDDDRGAVHEHDVSALFDGGDDARRQFRHGVSAALLGDQPAAECGKALLGDVAGLVEDAFLEAGEPRLDQRNVARHESGYSQQRLAIRGEICRLGDRRLRHGERDDLDRRDHLARLDDGEGGQGAQRHRLVHQVELVEPVAVEHQQAARVGKQGGASGERGRDRVFAPRHGDKVAAVLAQIPGRAAPR
jgi:hypothetical protein